MGLAFNRLPGEWHGIRSISEVFNCLNKVYKPFDKLETCIFDSLMIWDKVERIAKRPARVWIYEAKQKMPDVSAEKREFTLCVDALFGRFINYN